jgi:transposase
MMGHRQVEWAALFYKLSLEKHIPVDHLLRSLTRLHVLGEINRDLALCYDSIGRPSIDLELMIRILSIHRNGVYAMRVIQLSRPMVLPLGLDGTVPDRSTLYNNRHGRFRESDLFRRVLESALRRCIAIGWSR